MTASDLFSGETSMLAGCDGEPALLMRRLARNGPPVLYIHGATFPSALSVAYRFEGRSWLDDLAARGFDAWAFDFAGYGGSERPDGFARPAMGQAPIGRAADACAQVGRVVRHIRAVSGGRRVRLIAHSWGSMPAAMFASAHPDFVARLALFGPIARRNGEASPSSPVGWRKVTVAQQRARFVEDAPPGHPPVLIEPDLAQWGPAYLATDPSNVGRAQEPAVQIPFGPSADIADAWVGRLPYNPAQVNAPTLIVRGEWDHLCDDADAEWFLSNLGAREMRDAKIPKGSHLMHLERSREGLFAAVGDFLHEDMSDDRSHL